MLTLADAMLSLAQGLEQIHHGLSTGGSATTLVDTNDTQTDDMLNGTIFFVDRKKTAIITGYDPITHTYTFATQSPVIAASERYAVLSAHYTRADLISAINAALFRFGMVEKVTYLYPDVAGEQFYDLPTDCRNLLRVEYSTATEEPYNWTRSYFWEEINGQLFFDNNKSSEDITVYRIFYLDFHDDLVSDTDVIQPTINPERLKWESMQIAAQFRATYTGNKEEQTTEILKLAMQKSAEYAIRYPVVNRARDPHLNA